MTMIDPSSPPALPALQLRCREAEWVDRPQTLTDFSRPARLPKIQRCAGLTEALIADAIARSHYEIDQLAGNRVVVSCETPRYGIPLGVRELDRPPVEEWLHREELSGELLDVNARGELERSVSMQVRRGLIAVAGTLPLLLGPTMAYASGPSAAQSAFEQLIAFAPPPSLPAEGPQPASEGEPTDAPPVDDPASAPPTTAPAPQVDGNLTLTGKNLWDGLLGQQLKLDMKNGASVAGMLVAQSGGELAIARAPDGTVVSVPKAEVTAVRVRPDSVLLAETTGGGSSTPLHMRPLKDGRGLHGGGIVMISIGSIATLSGTVLLAIFPYSYYLFMSLPLLLPGLAMVGGGVGMMVSAGKKRKAFNEAWGIPSAKLQLTPTLRAGRTGGQAGLVLRF